MSNASVLFVWRSDNYFLILDLKLPPAHKREYVNVTACICVVDLTSLTIESTFTCKTKETHIRVMCNVCTADVRNMPGHTHRLTLSFSLNCREW